MMNILNGRLHPGLVSLLDSLTMIVAKSCNRFNLLILVVVILFLNAGCGVLGVLADGPSGAPAPRPAPAPGPRSYPSYRALNIPPGHLPPPGQCRIWYPGKPPGHQPPPVSCESALRTAGANSWVIYRDSGNPKHLEVKEKKGSGPKVEIIISHYVID